jgi:hypothetical protein
LEFDIDGEYLKFDAAEEYSNSYTALCSLMQSDTVNSVTDVYIIFKLGGIACTGFWHLLLELQ